MKSATLVLVVLIGLGTMAAPEAAEAAKEPPPCTADNVRVVYKDAKVFLEEGDGQECSRRWIGPGTNRKLTPVVLADECEGWSASIKEEVRRSRFATDLRKLVDLLRTQARAPECELTSTTLQLRRSTVKVSFKHASSEEEKAAIELIVGPKERLSLSANGVLNDIEQAELNEAGDELTLTENPPKALLGLDYAFFDLATPDSDGWLLKVFVEASDRPGNTLGVGASYRGRVPLGNLGSLNLTAVSPFVGAVWVREDEIDADGRVRRQTRGDAEFAFGLSFNLEKLGEWLANDEDGDK